MIDHPTLNHIPFRVTSVADMFGVTEGDTFVGNGQPLTLQDDYSVISSTVYHIV